MALTAAVRLLNAFLIIDVVRGMPWVEPVPTPAGLMAMNGMSPRPTNAPLLQDAPQDLLRRAGLSSYIYPPPDNWCGFVSGQYSNVLSCNTAMTCIHSGPAIGCCTALTGNCAGLYTTCVNYGGDCGQNCQLDTKVISCDDVALPYCGTFAFAGGSRLYNCQSTTMPLASVEYLLDFYSTASGITLISSSAASAPSRTSISNGYTDGAATETPGTRATAPSTSSSSVPVIPSTNKPKARKLAVGAIAGIAAGIGLLILAVIAGILVFFCIRKRNKQHAEAPQTPHPRPPVNFDNNPPMQQAFNGQGYQDSHPKHLPLQPGFTGESTPQPNSPYTNTYASTYGSPPSPLQPSQGTYDPINRASTVSPNPLSHDPSISGSVNPLPLNSSVINEVDQKTHTIDTKDGYYKQPLSPMVTEINGVTAHQGFLGPIPPTLDHGDVHEASSEQHYNANGQQPHYAHEVPAVQQHAGNGQQTHAPSIPASQQQYTANSNQSYSHETSSQQVYHHTQIHEAPGTQPHNGPWELSERQR